MPWTQSLAALLASLSSAEQTAILAGLGPDERAALARDWRFLARPGQLPPPGDWTIWLQLAGRGYGKTRSGAEFIDGEVRSARAGRIALVAPTAADARDVMVEGPSGLLAIAKPEHRPKYEPSKRRLTWPNGARASLFSAEEPDRLRGPQHDAFWGDEPAAWKYYDAFDQLMFGLRLGSHPRGVLTTTPKPTKLILELTSPDRTDVALTGGTTYENAAHLAPAFLKTIIRRYEGSRLGRQELLAELLRDVPGALWTLDLIEQHRRTPSQVPELKRIGVAIDPAVTAGEESDETGLVVGGIGVDDHAYVLEDLSGRWPPIEWARKAVNAYQRREGDFIVGEANNGGDLVEAQIRVVDRAVPFRKVTASRGKRTRAEPVQALYEQGRVHHVGNFPDLEGEMTSWVPDAGMDSPSRHDALVWLLSELMVEAQPFVGVG